MINAALIGAGDWGLNLARNIHALEGLSLKWICDKDAARIARIARHYPESRISQNMTEILHNDQIGAVVIATPASLHYEHVKAALEAGKHVLVEKPFALTAQHAQDLIDLSEKNNRVLMVGHTFLYNPAVRKVKEIIRNGELGKVFCVYSNRLSLGRVRDDVNVMWNLAPHDVSILLYLFDQMPKHVSARGFRYLQNKLEDAVYLFLEFPDRLFAFIHNTWLNPTKVRSMTVIGSEKSLIYDDTSPDEKVVVYDCGFDKEPAPAEIIRSLPHDRPTRR